MTVDELILQLDAKFPRWELWRADFRRHWVSRSDLAGECLVSASLTECLQLLLDYKPLPVVPRQPTLLTLDRFTAKKSFSFWSLFHDGREYSHHHKTKKEAMRCADSACKRSSKLCAEWADKYSELVARGKEGVDFRWED